MSLNIKSREVHELARELADRTNTTMTSAVEDALRRRLDEVRQREERSEGMAALLRLQAMVTDADRAALDRIMEEMYDENGLPR